MGDAQNADRFDFVKLFQTLEKSGLSITNLRLNSVVSHNRIISFKREVQKSTSLSYFPIMSDVLMHVRMPPAISGPGTG